MQVLARTKLLDSASEEIYDRFTRLAAMLLDVPISLVSLVDRDRQYFKSYYGLPEPWATQQQTQLSHSFCQYVVAAREPLIVKDAREEGLLKENLAIPDLGVIAYLGFPLMVDEQPVGSFCAIDHKPRTWTEREIAVMHELANFVATEITLNMEVAERLKVTERLRVSEERFRTLANVAPITIWQADSDGMLTFLNAQWYAFTGLAEEASLGDGWANSIHPDDRAEILALWTRTLADSGPWHATLRLRRADGIYREVVAQGSAYRDERQTFLGYIGTMLDVSEQKELDVQREAFLGMTTHELKTPLTAIQGNIQLAQRRINGLLKDAHELNSQQQATLAQVMHMLARSLENLHLQTRLINDLLDFSRVQADKLEFHVTSCDLIELATQTVQEQQMANPQRLLFFEFPPTISCTIMADPQRVKQALGNYITNALKYSPLDQPVEVVLASDEESATISVIDHGAGLTAEQQIHIWERFYQTNELPRHSGSAGLGLGLYICQALIRGQHGKVGVESTRGEGSTFWFTLPLH